jgi:outer membrane protein OmpA-like peptidoglycan-associated protein
LTGVRLHTDATADRLSREVGALAFTAGQDVFFRAGNYQPDSATGLHLLAHEAAHTAQPLDGSMAAMPVAPGVFVGEEHSAAECEAERTAAAAVAAGQDSGAAPAGRLTATPSEATGDPVRIQRFAGPEHRDVGDITMTEIDLGNGMILTWGEVVALAGDEFGTAEELAETARTADGRARLRAAMEHDRLAPRTVSDAAWAERERALAVLAMQNIPHFAAGGTAIETWTTYHAQALHRALAAGRNADSAAYQSAELVEAFGQHFLTDSFSGGHIRTPRAEISAWYTDEFAPRVALPFLDRLRQRLVDTITAEISPQTNWPDFIVAGRVGDQVDRILNERLAAIGGRAGFVHWFGLAIGGAVSGAMHDLEGVCGVRVTSEAHPEPWQAYGDGSLTSPPPGGAADVAVSREQVQLAVLAAQAQLGRAQDIGLRSNRTTSAATQPHALYFGFDSSTLDSPSTAALDNAAEHLRTHPEWVVHLVGHTDPTGPDGYNDALGERRAEAAARVLATAGVPADQVVEVRSEGEHNPVAVDPAGFPQDRRVDLQWDERPGPWRDIAAEEADAQLAQEIPPPYQDVLRFVPHATPDNIDIENWRWGQMPAEFVGRVRDWVTSMVTPGAVTTALGQIDETMTVEGFTIHPRAAVQSIADDLLHDPIRFFTIYFGQAPGR